MGKAIIYISGKIGKDTTLVDVIRQFKAYENVTELEAIIHSEGGNVEEGNAIYNYLVNLSSEIPLTTITDKAYSIAAKIFASGQKRVVEESDRAIGIHFAWAKVEGDATKLELIASMLREIETEFVSFYSDFLKLDNDSVSALLQNETFFSAKEAVEMGFATEIKVGAEAVAEISINQNNENKMKKVDSKAYALLTAMAAFVGITLKKDSAEILAELTLQDATGTEIVFPDVDTDKPQIGDLAQIDGSKITDGSYIIPSLDDSTLVFVDGKITEIIEKEAEVMASIKKMDAKKVDINGEEVQQINVWTMEVTNTSFAEGDVVKYKDWDGNEAIIGAGEYQLSDGRRVVTDATGVIVKIKEANDAGGATVDTNPEMDTQASFEDLLKKVSDKVKIEIKAEFDKKLADKEKEIIALKAKIGTPEFKAELKDTAIVDKKEDKADRAARILRAAKF